MKKIIEFGLLFTLLFSVFSLCAYAKASTDEAASVSWAKYDRLFSGIVDGNDNVFIEQVEKDGITVIKATANTKGEFRGTVGLDNYGKAVSSLCVNLDVHKYISLIYKYEGEMPENTKPSFYIATHNGEISGGAVLNPKSVRNFSGGWKCALFEIPDLTDKYLTPDTTHFLEHFHINPFGRSTAVTSLSDTSTVYLHGIIFSDSDNIDAEFTSPYISGMGDGTFLPSNMLTRAQACTLVCNILGADFAETYSSDTRFTDINDSDYFGYIAYCEDLGLLSAYKDTFSPDAYIAVDEFCDIILKAVFEINGDINGIGKGTLNSLPSEYITRAGAVSFINTVLCKGDYNVQYNIKSPFADVSPDLWAYNDIMLAAKGLTFIRNPGSGEYEGIFEIVTERELDEELYILGEEKLAELEVLEKKRINEIKYRESNVKITGTAYYFSADGNDSNNGKSPDYPKKSLEELSKLELCYGDGVLFKSGDTFRGSVTAVSGVTYSSYGGDEKPVITASPADFNGEANWVETDTPNVWKLTTPITNDVGLIVFNGGEAWTEKRIKGRADFLTGALADLDKDLTMWHDVSMPTNEEGYVYLRSDSGNPGKRFDSIELSPRNHIIRAADDILIDNICFKYTGGHAVSSGDVNNLTIENCVFEFIGGSWFRTDTLSRFGNAVEVYGGCDGYVVNNCYITQVYDAGVTHQLTASPERQCIMKNIKYTNNVITDTSYPIEYFINAPNEGVEHKMENLEISGNIILRTGYGFGHQRPDKEAATAIKGWNTYNEAYNYTLSDNIFAVSRYYMMAVGAGKPEWSPECNNNTYVHYYRGEFGTMLFGTESIYDYNIKEFITKTSGDENVQIYYLRNPGYGN